MGQTKSIEFPINEIIDQTPKKIEEFLDDYLQKKVEIWLKIIIKDLM